MKKEIAISILLMIVVSAQVFSQHNEHMKGMDMKTDTLKPRSKTAKDTAMTNMSHDNMQVHDHMDMEGMEDMDGMHHAYSLHLPMSRDGSGTGWLPDASPMYGYMAHTSRWSFMLHGNAFLRYTTHDFTHKGTRGSEKFDAPNWLMLMGQRNVGNNGLLHFNAMLSLDPLTEGGNGYPLLFQSGESWKGKPLVDRQHPHDLFSELSVSYAQALSANADVYAYLGYPGEPALGPVAFMHRPSALSNPDAPISHHWIDATHITFGVATLGIRLGAVKLEGSSFTGREPNENRYNFDRPRFDSWSGRLSYNPSSNWALQASHGFIKTPEMLHPDEDVSRTTASAIYSLPLAGNRWLNATALWGMNKTKGHNAEHAVLVEGSFMVRKLSFHTRYEWVQKSVEELVLDESVYGHGTAFPVNAFTIGMDRDLFSIGNTDCKAGTQFTYYHADVRLNSLYGKNPLALEVYLRIAPGIMKM